MKLRFSSFGVVLVVGMVIMKKIFSLQGGVLLSWEVLMRGRGFNISFVEFAQPHTPRRGRLPPNPQILTVAGGR